MFGALKSKGKAKWKCIVAQDCWARCSRQIGAEFLLQLSDELSESGVAAGWNFAKPTEEDEESESEGSDGEFELIVR
jgi:heterodisulfide reductase subunit C